MKTVFLRVLESKDKASALLNAVRAPAVTDGHQRFEVDPVIFSGVPRSPFAYWVSERVLGAFVSEEPFNNPRRLVVSTNPLNDDFRYVRSWWEVPPGELRRIWIPWAKGGSYSPFYYDIDVTIRWDNERLTYAGFLGTENRPLERPASVQHFFRPGLTWPRRTNGFSLRIMPKGCIFADKGPAVFVNNDDPRYLLALVGVANSCAFNLFVSLQLARTELAQSYEVGLIQTTPIPRLNDSDVEALARLARRAWSLKRSIDTSVETSHAFVLPTLLQIDGADLAGRARNWGERVRVFEAELAGVQADIDSLSFALYGMNEADRRAVTEGLVTPSAEGCSSDGASDQEDGDTEDGRLKEDAADVVGLATGLASWAVGSAFGRFDVRLAIDSVVIPGSPEPFDPLPISSPGMLAGDDGLPLARSTSQYPISIPESGVLVDDPGHELDLSTAIRAVFDTVFGAAADRWWSEVAALLDPRGHDLRSWLAGNFFEYHLKRHSKSRRKAPILWQLGTPSGTYSLWLYAQRLTRDSFFQLQNDVVGPKLVHEERQLTNLVRTAGSNPSAPERKEIAAQEAVIDELRAMLDEVKKVAPLWNPHLDDGVVLTMAPLWRLVPQHKRWQRELKSRWDDLAAGKYEWARVAMHLWPERVVPKCAADRSLAIAHGLEDVFWLEDSDRKWHVRETPTIAMDQVIGERTSAAVKAALINLLDAQAAAPTKGRSRTAVTQ